MMSSSDYEFHSNPSPSSGKKATPDPPEAVPVCVRITGSVPLAVVERGPWTEPPLVLSRANGTTDVRGSTYDLDAAARWVLERGARAQVVDPLPLRQRVASEAWRIYRRYRCDDVLSRTG